MMIRFPIARRPSSVTTFARHTPTPTPIRSVASPAPAASRHISSPTLPLSFAADPVNPKLVRQCFEHESGYLLSASVFISQVEMGFDAVLDFFSRDGEHFHIEELRFYWKPKK
jgi:hypothetical protein